MSRTYAPETEIIFIPRFRLVSRYNLVDIERVRRDDAELVELWELDLI